VADVTDQAVQARGPISIVVANAGIAEGRSLLKTEPDFWRQIMATNLDGVFLCTQAATPALKQTKGVVVNIASISGLRASTLRVAYGTSKAAVIHLTKQHAAELGEYGIRVNCVCPGPVRTKLAMAVHSQEIIDAYHDAIPLNRYGSGAFPSTSTCRGTWPWSPTPWPISISPGRISPAAPVRCWPSWRPATSTWSAF
jgi:NAD(P)-dependent dehydrogenase (short-subunit alcohol dehydrogenase family)